MTSFSLGLPKLEPVGGEEVEVLSIHKKLKQSLSFEMMGKMLCKIQWLVFSFHNDKPIFIDVLSSPNVEAVI